MNRLDPTADPVGQRMESPAFGPLSLEDTTRWAGVQENYTRLHLDRDWARDVAGARSFIASGEHRQALLLRALQDWAGPRAWIAGLRVRHSAPTCEGDSMRFSAEVTEAKARRLVCTVKGVNQDGAEILAGSCEIVLAG